MASSVVSHEHCDSNALPAERTAVSSLASDRFYKLCPGHHAFANGTRVPLGQPRCGDGSNYAFFVSRPATPASGGRGREKIALELAGGGACWDEVTCAVQAFALAFPSHFDAAVGSSCADNVFRDLLLCSKTIGDTDFSTYTHIVIPYCTQDVHSGDAPAAPYGVRHVGAHNLYRTLQWIFDNFADPSHIFLTGCSAGGTPLTVVYDLIRMHYASVNVPVAMNAIADSPVFLTPKHFLQNFLPNWNMDTILKMVDFDVDKYRNNESFPLAIMDHVFERGNSSSKWGMATHRDDPTSHMYYTAMNGDLFGRERQLSTSELNDSGKWTRRAADEVGSRWWTEMNSSLNHLMTSNSNFDAYIVDGEGHCDFGLVRTTV